MNIVEERLKKWKNKLIDLSKRNRLLNFRPTKVTTIRIVDEIPSEIFHTIVVENTSMEFLPIPQNKEEDESSGSEDSDIDLGTRSFKAYERGDLKEKHKDKYLQTALPKEKLYKNLFRVYSKASSVMEEQGYNVLFLALGCLEWYESESSEEKLTSPIILVPVELKRKSVKNVFTINYLEEAPILNPALTQKLSRDFGITLKPLDEDLESINPQHIFQEVQKAVSGQDNWRVTNDICLSLFSFAKFVMYKDLETFMKSLLGNKIIQLICGQADDRGASLNLLCEPKELESQMASTETLQILDADSSQQRAILAVKKGANLLIEGPPGTGKSQTIANMISECLAQNKKVLFVSQKMAALEVVKNRLEANKLGDFCLELHSRKTNKTAIIKELVKTLELRKKPDHAHDRELLELEKVRDDLNNYVKELHAPYANLEMTPYQAFSTVCSHPEIEDMGYIFKDVKEWSRDKFNKCCDLLDSYYHNLTKIHDPDQHPWKGSKLTEFYYEDKVKLTELTKTIEDAYPDLQNFFQKFAQLIIFKDPKTIDDLNKLLSAAELLINVPQTQEAVLKNELWNSWNPEVSTLLNAVKQWEEFKHGFQSKYKIEVVDLDINSILERYRKYSKGMIFIILPSFWRDRKLLKQHMLANYRPKLKQLINDLENIDNVKQEIGKIDKHSELGVKMFGALWDGRQTSHKAISEFGDWIVKFRSYVVNNCFGRDIFDKITQNDIEREELKISFSSGSQKLKNLKTLFDNLFAMTKMDNIDAFGCSYNNFQLDSIYKKVINMHNTIENLDLWIRYQSSYQDCMNIGLEDFISKVKSQGLSFEKIVTLFKCQFLRCWLSSVFSERPFLKRFNGDDHGRLIDKFCSIDKKQIELAKIRLQHSLSGRVDSSHQASTDSELGILLRESRKVRAHKPIRKLFRQIPNVITSLKPCLMMSPLSVAQFIDPSLIQFDVVIFDEASQIPPEDSLGAIARGKQVIIAGDSKQLPPTSFFQSEVIMPEDEGGDFEDLLPDDLGSILDECAASQRFPRIMLEWHYRSKHESLITFSNRSFYGGRLNTFPNSEEETQELGVKFNYIPNTFYDRGGTGTNKEEAKEVAKAVFEHFKRYPHLSLGVGTFNIRQKYAIEDSIEEMLREDNSLESFFAQDKHEHFFIKNLEIIQGDERDVIFISIGYGKDSNGRLSMNFGPINKNGGHRRLNVLVTRARQRIEIFSSIKGDDFDLSKTDKMGVNLLKKYLDFAEKGYSALEQDIDETVEEFSESPFEESVYDMLINKGIRVKRQVGCSGYRIDLGVIDNDNPGRYVLGIECDGANYHSSATARDRDRLRQQVLESLGWEIHRIWSTDWFKNPKREFEKLLNAIEKARQNNPKKKVLNSDEHVIKYKDLPLNDISEVESRIKPYSKLAVTKVRAGSYWSKLLDHFYNCESDKIFNILLKVIRHESPIHKDEAMRRVVQHWGTNTLTDNMRERIKYAMKYASGKSKIRTAGNFYWASDMERPVVRLRDAEDLRKGVQAIAPEEIGEAAIIVLTKEYGMPKDSLIVQTAKLLGYRRVTEEMNNYLWDSILKTIVKEKKVKEVDSKYVVNRGE